MKDQSVRMNGKERGKGKWQRKKGRPQHVDEKENVALQNKFKAA